MHRGGLV